MSKTYSNRKVLVADDEVAVAKVAALHVQSMFGCDVSIVHNGDDAVMAVSNTQFDVMITDMRMPGICGLELVDKVSRLRPEMPIIVTTSFAQEFTYLDVIQHGATDFLPKPYEPSALQAKLLRLFREGEFIGSLAREKQQLTDDVETLRKMREAQVEAEEQYHSLFEHNMNGMLVVNSDGYTIRDMNRAFCALSGHDRNELHGRGFLDLLADSAVDRVRQGLAIVEQLGQATLSDVLLMSGDRKGVWLDVSANIVRSGREPMIHIACKDVSEQREMQRQLAEIAHTDQLTGLLNKRTFYPRLEGAISQAVREDRPVTLLFLDLDNFKQCNDNYGHQIGDEVLRGVGDVIHKHVRATDHAFRYGGDEFAILLIGAKVNVGEQIGGRIRDEFGGERFGTSISIGVTQFKHTQNAVDFVKGADDALYRAKLAGKNQVCVI